MVAEKFGWHDRAVAHAEAAAIFVKNDPMTDQRPTTRIWAHMLRGRVLAAMGTNLANLNSNASPEPTLRIYLMMPCLSCLVHSTTGVSEPLTH